MLLFVYYNLELTFCVKTSNICISWGKLKVILMCLMNAKRKFLDSIEFTVSSHMTVFHCNRFPRIVYIRSQD